MIRWQRLKQPNVWIPAAFFAFFGVIFLANGIMIWSALGSWRGLETESPWAEYAAYEGEVDTAAAERVQSWQVDIEVTPSANGDTRIAVALRNRNGQAVAAGRVRAGFIRPTDEGYDTMAQLSPTGPGTYAADVTLPLAGLWEVRVVAEHDGAKIQRRKRVNLQP